MTGFWIVEMPRDVRSMNIFSTIAGAHVVADRVRPSRDGFLRGRSSHGVAFSVVLPRAIHSSSWELLPLPFPAAQPASAPTGRREDIDSRPDFSRRSSPEMLMRTEVIVAAARVGQGPIQRPGILNGVLEEQPFDGSDETFDTAVLPGASRIAVLQTNAHAPQDQAKQPRREHRFVISAQELRAAVVTTDGDEVAPDRQRRLIRHSLHAQTGATGMVHDGQHDVLPTDSIRLHQQIHTPDQVAGNGARDVVFQGPPYRQDGVVLSSERVRDVRFAHRHVPPLGEAAVEAVGNRPTSRLRHEGFEADEFVSDPARFRRRMRATPWPTCAGTWPIGLMWASQPDAQPSVQNTTPSNEPRPQTQHHAPLSHSIGIDRINTW